MQKIYSTVSLSLEEQRQHAIPHRSHRHRINKGLEHLSLAFNSSPTPICPPGSITSLARDTNTKGEDPACARRGMYFYQDNHPRCLAQKAKSIFIKTTYMLQALHERVYTKSSCLSASPGDPASSFLDQREELQQRLFLGCLVCLRRLSGPFIRVV